MSLRTVAWGWRNCAIERIADWGGRFLYKGHLLWLQNDTWKQPYERQLLPDTRRDHPSLIDRRFTLLQFCNAVRSLPGSTAECGVQHGVGSALICKALEGTYRDNERHFAFDAFEGLAEPAQDDITIFGRHWWSRGSLAVKQNGAEQLLSEFEQCQIVVGWIPNTFDDIEHGVFRFVHIDVDLYEATRDSIGFFYPRLVPGGIMLFDDHGFASCPGARKAANEFADGIPEPLIELATGQAFLVKD